MLNIACSGPVEQPSVASHLPVHYTVHAPDGSRTKSTFKACVWIEFTVETDIEALAVSAVASTAMCKRLLASFGRLLPVYVKGCTL